jgi:Methylase involved in ubiquinone/menaquinone biosynthesis
MDICDLSKIEDNNHIYLFKGDIANIAARDNSIEAVISRSVLEHIENPIGVYREVHRVLKPGGTFIFLTPNKYDYASILATLIPNRFHAKIVKMTEGRDEHDTFPTYYRANTKRTILNLAKSTGFKVVTISMLSQYPSYLTFNPLLFLMGTAYDKIICRYEFLSCLRGWILCVLQKRHISEQT